MKRYTEYKPEEMAALTHEQIEKLIDLEIAHAGIIPEEYPVLTAVPTVDIKPCIKVYECDGVLFSTIEDANTFQNMKRFTKSYDYSFTGSSEYTYLDEVKQSDFSNGIKTVMFYDKKELHKIKSEIKRIVEIKKNNEYLQKKYDKYIESINSYRNNVYNAYRNAVEIMEERKKALNVFKKHIELADNNREVAEKFFKDAYKDYPDIINYVLSENI